MLIGGTHRRRGAPGRTAPSTFADPTRWGLGAALLLTAALTLGACANGTPTATPSPTPTSTTLATTSATTTTTSPTTTPTSPSPTTNTLAERFPETQKGAEAFLRFALDQLNEAYATASPSLVAPLLNTTTCANCKRWVEELTSMNEGGRRLKGVFVDTAQLQVLEPRSHEALAIMMVRIPLARIVDSQSRVVRTRPEAGPIQTNMRMIFTDHWRIAAMETME